MKINFYFLYASDTNNSYWKKIMWNINLLHFYFISMFCFFLRILYDILGTIVLLILHACLIATI